MERYLNKKHAIGNSEFQVKSANQLLPVDITLHPIYREDGLMLVNRYTTLYPMVLKQIQKHINDDMPIPVVVASSEEQLQNFLECKVYSEPEFILLLDNIMRASIHCFNVPIAIDTYVDERVDMRLMAEKIAEIRNLQENEPHHMVDKETKNRDEMQKTEENTEDETNASSILSKMKSTRTIWKDFETRLIDTNQQKIAVEIKDHFFKFLTNDKNLVDLIYEMSFFDDLLLFHGTNAACLSILFGVSLGMPEADIINLAISALFCDIGFIKMDRQRYEEYKQGTLDDSFISEHIKKSLEVISTSSLCRNKAIVFGILEHHECYNGAGLPTRKKGKDLSLFGRILGIVMKYEIYIKDFHQGNMYNMVNAEKILIKNKECYFDQEILNIYQRRVNMNIIY